MSAPRILFDEDIDERIITGLTARVTDIEITTVREQGLGERPDPIILEWAAAGGYLLISHDVQSMVGFAYDRVRQGLSMVGLVIVPQRMEIGPAIEQLELIAGASEGEEWQNRVVFLPFR